MKMPEVRKYVNELTGLVKQRDGVAGAIDELTALMRAANGAGDRNQQLQFEKQRSQLAKQLVAIDAEALATSRRLDFEGVRQLQIDISLRVDEAIKAYVDWRKMTNEYEFSVMHNGFAPEPEAGAQATGFTRAMADLELDKAKKYVEDRLAFAAKAVPERPVLIL